MNAKQTAQDLITELMADFSRFPERMIPLGPIENLQMKIEALLREREKLLADANRGAEINARVNGSLAHQLNGALTTLQKIGNPEINPQSPDYKAGYEKGWERAEWFGANLKPLEHRLGLLKDVVPIVQPLADAAHGPADVTLQQCQNAADWMARYHGRKN